MVLLYFKSLLFHDTKYDCDKIAGLSGVSWHINIFFSVVESNNVT